MKKYSMSTMQQDHYGTMVSHIKAFYSLRKESSSMLVTRCKASQ